MAPVPIVPNVLHCICLNQSLMLLKVTEKNKLAPQPTVEKFSTAEKFIHPFTDDSILAHTRN